MSRSNHYSLQMIDDWITDAMQSDCTPDEIHETIVRCIRRNIRFHQACLRASKELHEKIDRPYYDLISLETNANSPYNDGWTRQAYQEELDKIKNEENKPSYDETIKAGYEMSADGFWMPPVDTLDDTFEKSVRERKVDIEVEPHPDYTEL